MEMATLYEIYRQHPQICTDSRKISPGCLFFALKGENFNGNRFAATALEQGAAFAIVDEKEYQVSDRCFLVENVLRCLQELAAHHRRQFEIPLLAVTGSNGKTTTKELLARVLQKKYRLHYTKGNLNNHIGIPLTLLSMSSDTEFALIEMGANHQHEIEDYCRYAMPTHGLITNIGKAHLEGFGGLDGVEKGKTELFRYLQAHNGIGFYHSGSERICRNVPKEANWISYGNENSDFLSGQIIKEQPYLQMEIQQGKQTARLESQLSGRYNAENILAAACVGIYFGIDIADLSEAIASYAPDNNRSQIAEFEGNQLILDAYNANPSSMMAALDNLAQQSAANKMAVLGDMLEMGEYEEDEHRRIIEKALSLNIPIWLIGPRFFRLSQNYSSSYLIAFPDTAAAANYWKDNKPQHCLVLLKGSRGIGVERILPAGFHS